MKTLLSPKYFLMITALSLAVASCKKESLPYRAVVNNGQTAVEDPSAIIVDLGPSDSIPHLMLATISHQNVVLSDGSNENPVTDAVITFTFYSDAAGIIPSGTYKYLSTGTLKPFTFTQGILKSATITGSGNDVNLSVTGGTVFVAQETTGYDISFVLDLPTGQEMNGTYSGSVQYSDNSASGYKK